MEKSRPIVPEAIRRVLRLIAAHPAVEGILASGMDLDTGAATVDVALRLGLPSMLVTAVKLPVEEAPESASLLCSSPSLAASLGVGLASHDDLLSVRAHRALAPHPVFAFGET